MQTQKSLYGLKQASKQWHATLSATIVQFGFIQSKPDYVLFIHLKGSSFTALLVYVDDILITGKDPYCVTELKKLLDSKFAIKDFGALKYFLGLEVARNEKGISLNQKKFALEVLKDSGMLGCKLAKIPMKQHLGLSNDEGKLIMDNIEG